MSEYGQWIKVTIEDGIATIRLDRPKMNPIDADVQESLGRAAADIGADESVRAAIITGGDKVFAAGADIKEMQAFDYVDMVERAHLIQDAYRALAELPIPTIADIEGYALGGGCELAMTCDFRVASKEATLGQPEILLGLIPGAGGTQRLVRLVGQSKAKDLVFSGRFVKADEALEIGLVDELVDAGTAYEAALERARTYAKMPRIALRFAKELINRSADVDLATGLAKKHGARLHVLHLTTARELAFFTPGPVQGKRITVEACVHHLLLDDSDYATRGSLIKCNPAVKTAASRKNAATPFVRRG